VGYGRHHHDEEGSPFWLADEWNTVVGLMLLEGVA
jgi:hypothetical protein